MKNNTKINRIPLIKLKVKILLPQIIKDSSRSQNYSILQTKLLLNQNLNYQSFGLTLKSYFNIAAFRNR